MHPVDIAVLVFYFAGITAMGLYFGRRMKGTEEYFLGNRSFPGWAIGLSMVGTSLSSISFLGYPADAFKTAWLRMIPNFMLPVAIVVAIYFFLPFFRRGNITSAFEYLEGRFGPSTRAYGASAFIIAQLVRISMILYLISELIHVFTGLPDVACVLLAGMFVSFYTVVGGIEAVVWTDVIQTVVLAFGGLLCLFILVGKVPGGIGEIISTASEAGKFQFAEYDTETNTFIPPSWDFTFFRKTALMMFLVGLTNWMAEYSSNQNVVQRYCASKSTAEAKKAMWICAFTSIPLWAFFMFLGTSFWVFFTANPTPETNAMLSGEASAEQIFPFFIQQYLPIGIAGLVVAAVLAAAMSSLDSSINAIATVTIVDLYRRHFVKGRDDAHYLKMARWFAVVSSVVMMYGAYVLITSDNIKTLQDTSNILTALTAGGLLGLFGLGFFTTRGDGRAVAVAIVATLIYSLYRASAGMEWFPDALQLPWLDRVDSYYTGILGHTMMFVLGFIAGSIQRGEKRDLTNLTVWTQDGKPLDPVESTEHA